MKSTIHTCILRGFDEDNRGNCPFKKCINYVWCILLKSVFCSYIAKCNILRYIDRFRSQNVYKNNLKLICKGSWTTMKKKSIWVASAFTKLRALLHQCGNTVNNTGLKRSLMIVSNIIATVPCYYTTHEFYCRELTWPGG